MNRPAASLIDRIFDRIGNPREWDEANRVMIWCLFFVPGTLVTIIYLDQVKRIDALTIYNWQFLDEFFLPMFKSGVVVFLAISAASLFFRKQRKGVKVLLNAALQCFAIGTATLVYSTGTLTTSFWDVVLGGFALALLLFEMRPVLAAFGTCLALIVGAEILRAMGEVPYAPWFLKAPFEEGRLNAPTWASMVILAGYAGISAAFMVILAYVVARWRQREEQVTGLSEFLQKAFGRYLSPEVVRSIIENPGTIEMGGQKRRITVLMTDLRGFTQFSERLEPEQVVRLLNRYYHAMVDICERHRGTVNDIIGDALLVTFGAPRPLDDHAATAVACAIEMQNAMAEVNAENVAHGLPELQMGIGINTDEVVVGNVGSEKRSKFGVIGAGVNLASRIESYTVGGQILVSASTREAAGNILRVDGEMEVRPKGAENAIRIYEVGGIAGDFNLTLSQAADRRVRPARPLKILYTALDGKHVGETKTPADVPELSGRSICFETTAELPLNTNVKLNLADVSPQLARLDIYAKITGKAGTAASEARFTAVPPEIAAYIEAITAPGA